MSAGERRFAIAAVVAWACSFGVAIDRPAQAAEHDGFLRGHCVRCHGENDPGGGVRLDTQPASAATSTAAAERWQQVLGVLNAGRMPPDDEPQPPDAEKLAFLDWLSQEMVAARKKQIGRAHV